MIYGPEVAGYVSSLQVGLTQNGIHVRLYGYQDPLRYQAVPMGRLDRTQELLEGSAVRPTLNVRTDSFSLRIKQRFRSVRCVRQVFRVVRELSRSVAGVVECAVRVVQSVWLGLSFDAIIYSSGRVAPASVAEFSILRALGCRTVVTFHGSDARPPYLDGSAFDHSSPPSADVLRKLTAQTHRRVTRVEKSADLVIVWQGITHFFTKSVFTHEGLGFPYLRSGDSEIGAVEETRSLRALHCPSNPGAKGTSEIQRAFVEEAFKGYNIELRVVQKVSNRTVLQEIKLADVVIDQVHSDNFCGRLAAEASEYSKPVLVAGRALTEMSFHPEVIIPPTCWSSPVSWKHELCALVSDQERRASEGSILASYVDKKWNPGVVANMYLNLLSGRPSVAPTNSLTWTQVRGGYASDEFLKGNISRLVAKHGIESLRLNHNPELLQNVLSFASLS